MFKAKDFIETADGLIFAVVSDALEAGKVLCFLRYVLADGRWRKVDTEQANTALDRRFPHYRHFSQRLEAHLHAVPVPAIVRHFQPWVVLQTLLARVPVDPVVADLHHLCDLMNRRGLAMDQFGITGSLLVGLQKHSSDIDLVCYDREMFHRARQLIEVLIAEDALQALNDDDWLSAFQRRACDFALDDYIWHEQRKYNKAMINQRKFDLSLVMPSLEHGNRPYRKLGWVQIEAEVSDDEFGFDYPARFAIKHPEIDTVVCFTATYCGQAQQGEWISVAGQLEVGPDGGRRIVVGSTREALGEFIKVLR